MYFILFYILHTSLDPCDEKVCHQFASCSRTETNTAKCVCRQCENEYKTVCGSDGLSYASQCYLELRACQANKEISVAAIQPCCM